MILRELITRFGFEVNKKDVNKYESTVKGLTSKALKFAAIFGGAFSLKGIINAGLSAEQAEFNLKRLAGVDFSKFKNILTQTRKELDGIKDGAGQLITDKNFFLSAAKFTEDLGRGADSLKLFSDLFSFAARQAALTGGNVNAMMEQLQSGITGGSFDFLKQLPEFDQVSVNTINELNKIFDPKEFGGQIGILQKSLKLREILGGVRAGQDESLRKMPDTILKANQAAKSFQNTMDKSGKSFNKVTVPVTNFLSKELKQAGDLIDKIDNKGFTDTLLESIFSDKAVDLIKGNRSQKSPVNKTPAASGLIDRSQSATIYMTNSIKVVSDDPRKAAAIIVQKLDDKAREARSQINKTEDRGDR